jgi:hypothetical protein
MEIQISCKILSLSIVVNVFIHKNFTHHKIVCYKKSPSKLLGLLILRINLLLIEELISY